MGFFKRISTTFKTNENTASDKAEDSDEMSNQIMVDKQERPVTTKQQIATHLSQGDPIEKLNLTEYSFNALTSAGIQTVGKLLKLVESGQFRSIHGLRSASILEIEVKLAHLEIFDNSEVEANTDTMPDQDNVPLSQEDATQEPSLPQHSPDPPIQTDNQTIGEVTQQVESGDLQTISVGDANTDLTSDQNDVPLSQEDATKKIRLTRQTLNQIKQTDIRTVGELLKWIESSKSDTTPVSGQEPISEINGRSAQVKTPDDSEIEAKSDTTPDQNDVSLSQEDSVERMSLTRHTFDLLKQTDIRTVGELSQWVESGRLQTIPTLGSTSISEIEDELARVKPLDDSGVEATSGVTSEQNNISIPQEDSVEESSLSPHSSNLLTPHTESQAAGELAPQVEAKSDTMPDQNDVSLSQEDSIQKLNLTEYSFNALTALGVKTVGEVLELVESGEHQPISTLGRKFIIEIEGKLAQAKILDDSETDANTDSQTVGEAVQPAESGELQITAEDEANSDTMPDKDNLSLSREDSTEKPSLTEHSPNQLDSQATVEVTQQVESTEPQTTSEGEANAILSQNDTYLSRGDAIERLNLSLRTLIVLKRADIRMVGELLQLVESNGLKTTRGLGKKVILEIEDKSAQVKIYENYANLSQEDSIEKLYLRNRAFNALTRAGVQTISKVLQLVESDGLETIPALGQKSIIEIKNKLAHITALNDSKKIEANRNAISDQDYVHLSLEDPIGQLDLTPRSLNALTRAKIRTIGEVLQLVESGRIKTLRGLGRKSIQEIKEKVIQAKFLNNSEVEASTDAIPRVVVRWQSELVNKQLSRGLLHEEAIIAEKPIKDWLAGIETTENNRVYEVLAAILGTSLNICEEIEIFLNQILGQYRMTILLSVHGFETKTLAQTGEELGLSRERVRQIRNELKDKVTSLSNLKARPALHRMQSALLIARDLGVDITYEQWLQRIRSSGLIGDWTLKDFVDRDAVEVMIAICNLLDDCKICWLQIPENLRHAIQPVTADILDAPAEIPDAFETLPNKVKRLINGHTKNSGGVHVRWLSQESGRELEEIRDSLERGGYKAFSEDWFIPKVLDNPHEISHFDVYHRCLRKMFQYCGPLSLDDVCAGLRHVVSKRKFPVPPPNVMAEIAQLYDYKCEDGLYCWEGESNENLNTSESVIMNCLEEIGPVLHHSELVHAFIENELSLPALSAALNYSPLFDKIESGLYKLRGEEVTYQDIERAKAAGEKQPLRPRIEYDMNGNIIVSVNLSAIAVGSGTIFSQRFPDLSGADWKCYVNGEDAGELNAVENELRRLKKPFELLNCQPGERVKFTFNTWERTVTIEKEEGNGKD